MRARSWRPARSARSCARRSILTRVASWPPRCTAPSAGSGWKPSRAPRRRSTRRRSVAPSRRAAALRKRAASSGRRPMCGSDRNGLQDAFWLNQKRRSLNLSPPFCGERRLRVRGQARCSHRTALLGRSMLKRSEFPTRKIIYRGRRSASPLTRRASDDARRPLPAKERGEVKKAQGEVKSSPAQPRIGPAFDLGRSDDLLGLVRVERAGGGGPAFGQNLHGEQFRIDLRLERSRRAHHAGSAVVRLNGLVRAEGYIPGIGLRHAAITPISVEGFTTRKKAAPRAALVA